jgi:hypothetical protein
MTRARIEHPDWTGPDMAIFEYTNDGIQEFATKSFAEAGIKEREDLQRLLRDQIEVIAPDTMVISEEFGDWEESNRRIDLLAVDRNGNLVVVELKRTDSGGHMELQAIRYAAMIASMTFTRAVSVYAAYLSRRGIEQDAEKALLDFLNWEDEEEKTFGGQVRIVLVSANFSKELTSTVLWLTSWGIDIRCVRVQPYEAENRILLDVQEVIPLPEAGDFIVQLREKQQSESKQQAERYRLRKQFWGQLLDYARNRTSLHSNRSVTESNWIAVPSGTPGIKLTYVINQHDAYAEAYIDRGKNSEEENARIFDNLYKCKAAIEQRFGGPLEWQRLDGKRATRIRKTVTTGGYRNNEAQWPSIHKSMVDAMIALEAALSPELKSATEKD